MDLQRWAMLKEKIPIALNVSILYIAIGSLISLMPAFYPSYAESKGATASQYGFVYGIEPLTLFVFGPIFGRYGSNIGCKQGFVSGAVLQGISGLLFAFLPYCEDSETFIALSYFLRIVQGVGTSMCWTSALATLSVIFPYNQAAIMAWTQTNFGLGYMLGPALGAYLYREGGFSLPFFRWVLLTLYYLCSFYLLYQIIHRRILPVMVMMKK